MNDIMAATAAMCLCEKEIKELKTKTSNDYGKTE